MSISLMTAIFKTTFFDLKDEQDNVTKASTAKLVLLAMADCANDEGEGAYPGLSKMEIKTSLSRQCIMNAYDALKFNGIITLVGVSKRNTNNYTINTQSFPKTFDDSKSRLLVNPVCEDGQPGLPVLVNPVDPNHTLTIQESSLTKKEEKPSIQKRCDLVDGYIALAQSPGIKAMARRDAILSAIGEEFRINASGKRWETFARFVDDRQQGGESAAVFFRWLKSQPKFDISFWPPARMEEHWPRAFETMTGETMLPDKDGGYN